MLFEKTLGLEAWSFTRIISWPISQILSINSLLSTSFLHCHPLGRREETETCFRRKQQKALMEHLLYTGYHAFDGLKVSHLVPSSGPSVFGVYLGPWAV